MARGVGKVYLAIVSMFLKTHVQIILKTHDKIFLKRTENERQNARGNDAKTHCKIYVTTHVEMILKRIVKCT